MSLTGLLRIFFRWKQIGTRVFLGSLLVGMVLAWIIPLRYEARITVERKPAKMTNTVISQEFDVTRLTSENQRILALLKSRFLMLQWLDALGEGVAAPQQLDKKCAQLAHSLTVKPVNFTDLYVLKVEAKTFAEAQRRADALVSVFDRWDSTQVQQESQSLILLLKKRLTTIRTELQQERAQIREQKLSRTLNLSGSVSETTLEADLSAKQRLYDKMLEELEHAEREMDPNYLHRVRVAIPATPSHKPVRSRGIYILTALLTSGFLAMATCFLMEWHTARIHRAGDIYQIAGSHPVMTFPKASNGLSSSVPWPSLFYPLVEAMEHVIRAQGSVVVQVVCPHPGDAQAVFCRRFSQSTAQQNWPACMLSIDSPDKSMADEEPIAYFREAPKPASHRLLQVSALSDTLTTLKLSHRAIFLDILLPPHEVPGNNLSETADLFCVIVESTKTTQDQVRLLVRQLERFPRKPFLFLLNQWNDPLPTHLRA